MYVHVYTCIYALPLYTLCILSAATAVTNISSNFQIGFGSFVDKRVSPFVSTNSDRQDDPCDDGCVSTYSYRHHVDLTDDSNAFNVSQGRR